MCFAQYNVYIIHPTNFCDEPNDSMFIYGKYQEGVMMRFFQNINIDGVNNDICNKSTITEMHLHLYLTWA